MSARDRLTAAALAWAVVFGLMMVTAGVAHADVRRVEKRDRVAPARVSYVDAVVRGGEYRFTYVELRNGAAFEVTDCRRPVRKGMRMRTVRRLCR